MQCSFCGATIPEGSQFCPSCGKRTQPESQQLCGNCRQPIRPGLKFCTSCGTPLAAIPVRPPVPPSTPAPAAHPQQPPYGTHNQPPSKEERRRKGMAPLLFWVPFGILLLLAALLFWVGKTSPVGWAILVICFLLLFLLRGRFLAAGALVNAVGWVGIAAALFLTLGLTASSGDSAAAASGSKSGQTPATAATTAPRSSAPASATTPAARPTAKPGPVPAPASTGVKLQNVAVGLGLDQDQRIQSPTSTIKPDVPELFLSVETRNVTQETAVDVHWIYLGTNDVVEGPTQKIAEDRRMGFSLTRPTKGWPAGQYRVVILLNGREAGSVDFSAQP